MSKIYMEKFRFQPKHYTLSYWQTENPVLLDGEVGIVEDGTETEWLKVGDGSTAWNDLPYKKGPKGDKGDKGDTGAAAGFGIPAASVRQLAEGANPTVNVGASGPDTAKEFTFSFGIPKGAKGDKGNTGATGAKGDKGDKGDKGEKGDKGDIGEVSAEQLTTAITASEEKERLTSSTLYANALKGTATGTAIRVDDVSPVEHTVGVKLRSKNLIPYPYDFSGTTTSNGVTCTVNSDASITVVGTATKNVQFTDNRFVPLQSGKDYTLSGYASGNGAVLRIMTADYGSLKQLTTANETVTFSAAEDMFWFIYVEAGTTVNATFKPQLELGSSATEYTPYIADFSAGDVQWGEENLIPTDIFGEHGTKETDGLIVTYNADGTITVNGASPKSPDYTYVFSNSSLTARISIPAGHYKLTGSSDDNIKTNISLNYTDEFDSDCEFKIDSECTARFSYEIRCGVEYDNVTIFPKLVSGDPIPVTVSCCGKNLIPYPYGNTTTHTVNGVTFTVRPDGGIELSGTSTAQCTFYFCYQSLNLSKGTTYTLSASGDYSFRGSATIYIFDSKQGQSAYIPLITDTQATFTPVKNIEKTHLYLVIPANRQVSGTIRVQLELGSSATEYEPYKNPTEYTASADGSVDGVMSISPTMTLTDNNDGAIMDVQYNRDINKAFAALEAAILNS